MKAYLVDTHGTLLGSTGISIIPQAGETVHLTEGSEQEIVVPDGTAFKVEGVCITVTVSALNAQTLTYMLHVRDKVVAREAIDET